MLASMNCLWYIDQNLTAMKMSRKNVFCKYQSNPRQDQYCHDVFQECHLRSPNRNGPTTETGLELISLELLPISSHMHLNLIRIAWHKLYTSSFCIIQTFYDPKHSVCLDATGFITVKLKWCSLFLILVIFQSPYNSNTCMHVYCVGCAQ